jgi:hypothetical protein
VTKTLNCGSLREKILPEAFKTMFVRHDINLSHPDVRTCIAYLNTDGRGFNTKDTYLNELKHSLDILSANVLRHYHFPIIIFYSWDEKESGAVSYKSENRLMLTPERRKKEIREEFPWLDIEFVDVSRHFPADLPKHLLENKVYDRTMRYFIHYLHCCRDMKYFYNGTTCSPDHEWKMDYLSMGRFFTVKMWREEILHQCDYVWRLDVDATLDEPIKKNFGPLMKSLKKKFAYIEYAYDPAGCVQNLDQLTHQFASKKGLTFKHRHVIAFVPIVLQFLQVIDSPEATYWGGFGVYESQFFCKNPLWLEYTDFLDSTVWKVLFTACYVSIGRFLQSPMGRARCIAHWVEFIDGIRRAFMVEHFHLGNLSRPFSRKLLLRIFK